MEVVNAVVVVDSLVAATVSLVDTIVVVVVMFTCDVVASIEILVGVKVVGPCVAACSVTFSELGFELLGIDVTLCVTKCVLILFVNLVQSIVVTSLVELFVITCVLLLELIGRAVQGSSRGPIMASNAYASALPDVRPTLYDSVIMFPVTTSQKRLRHHNHC